MLHREKETIILFNEEESVVNIYTYNAPMKRKLANYAAAYPELCRLVSKDKTGAVTYDVEKSRLSVNFKRPITEEEREEKRKRGSNNAAVLAKARKARFQRS